MIGLNDFKQTLHTFFIKNNAVSKFDTSYLSKFNIAMEDSFILKNIRKEKGDFVSNFDTFFSKLKNLDINQISVISNGVNLMNKYENFDSRKIFDVLLKINYLENYLEISEKKFKIKTLTDSFLDVFLKDSLSSNLYAEKLRDLIEKKTKKNNACYLNSIIMKENQLAYLFENEYIDCIFSSPLPILLSEKPLFVIYDINFEEQEFFYYNFEKLAENLDIKEDILKTCLTLSLLFFCLDENINKVSLIEDCINVNQINCKNSYAFSVEKRIKIIEDHIEYFKNKIINSNTNVILIKLAAEVFKIKKNRINFFYDVFFKTPVFSPNLDTPFYPKKSSLSTKNYFPENKKKELVTFYCLNYFNKNIFELLNKCNNYTHNMQSSVYPSYEYDQLVKNFVKTRTEKDLTKIIKIFKIEDWEKNKYYLNYDKQNLELKINEISENVESFDFNNTNIKKTSITNILVDFKKFGKELNRKIILNEINNISENQILYYIYFDLFYDLNFIDKNKSELDERSEFLLKIKKYRNEEEYIIFFLALENDLLNSEAFMGSYNICLGSAKTDLENFSELNKQNFSNFEIKLFSNQKKFIIFKNTNISKLFASVLKKANINYMHLFIIETNKILQSLIDNNKIAKENLEAIKDSILKTLNENFPLLDFLGKIAIILKPDFDSNYSSDIFCQQFSECLNLINQTLHSSLLANLSFLFMHSNFKSNLTIIDSFKKKLLFVVNYAPIIGVAIKIELSKFLIFITLKNKYYINCDFLLESMKESCFEKDYGINFNFFDFLAKMDDFLSNLCLKMNYDKKYKQVYDNVKFGKNLLKDYMKFLESNK